MDLTSSIEPKSDQLNADDLIAGPMVVRIRGVKGGSKEQPVDILLEGTDKAYRPSKGMRRVLVHVYGPDGNKYVGQSLRLYRDGEVTFGKDKVGGIRISHMTGIDRPMEMPITVARGKRAPFVVEPLRMEQQQKPPEPTLEGAREALETAPDLAALEKRWSSPRMAAFKEQLQGDYDARKAALDKPAPQQPADDGGFDAP